MPELSTHVVQCPYCGESLELVVDASAGAQRYVEDCTVCCRPIEVELDVDGGDVRIAARHENEA
jgi:hypothetical protein